MAETLTTHIVPRNDTAENWQSANPVLLKGEYGVETDTNRQKKGDNVTPWNDLPYATVTPVDLDNAITTEAATRQTEITAAVMTEAATRHTEIVTAISEEAADRQQQIDTVNQAVHDEAAALNAQIQATNTVLAGVHTATLKGAFLTRSIAPTLNMTLITRSLLDDEYAPGTMPWEPGKTLVFDENGTLGVIIACDNNNYTILTHAISPHGSDEPTLLGTVAAFADLPTTQDTCFDVFGRNVDVDDYARVRHDETLPGTPATEHYITNIDDGGNVTWGNYIILNTSDYQEQTGADAAGRILTGGAVAGTFGESIEPSVFVRKSDIWFIDAPVPPDVFGSVGQLCIAQNGIYRKIQKEIFDLYLNTSNSALNGRWIYQGVNPSTVYDTQGTCYYLHESGNYVLMWNKAYSGYFWINAVTNGDILSALGLANGSSYAYRSTPTYTDVPPNDNWSSAITDSPTWTAVNYRMVEEWTPFQLYKVGDDGHMAVNGANVPLMKDVYTNSYFGNGFSANIYNGDNGKEFSLYLALASGVNPLILDNNGLYCAAEGTYTYTYSNGTATAFSWNIASYPVLNLTSSLASGTLTISKTGTIKSGYSRYKMFINNTNAAGTSKSLAWSSWSITWDRVPLSTLSGNTKYAFEIWTYDGGSNWFGAWTIMNGSDYYLTLTTANSNYYTKTAADTLYLPKTRFQYGTGVCDSTNTYLEFGMERFVFVLNYSSGSGTPSWTVSMWTRANSTPVDMCIEYDTGGGQVSAATYKSSLTGAPALVLPSAISGLRRVKLALSYYESAASTYIPRIGAEMFIFNDGGAVSFRGEYISVSAS